MKIDIQIEIYADGSYGKRLAKRTVSIEASRLPSMASIVGDITNQTIVEAEDKEKMDALKNSTTEEPHSLPSDAVAF